MLRAFILLMLITSLKLSATEKKLSFGVVPQQSPTKLLSQWMPLIEKLKSHCHCEIDFHTAVDITTFENNIKKGEYDIVYLNPFHYVQAAHPVGYNALVKEKDRKLKGVLVVKNDSPINSIEDLKNERIALPGPTAFAASVLVSNLFYQKNIAFEPAYVKSHESVYTGVISGIFKAGGGVNRTFEALSDEQKKHLKILTTTIDVTPHPIAIHERVDKKTQLLFQDTLINLDGTPEGKKILEELDLKALVKADNKDWDDVRKLIKKIEVPKVQ